MVTAPDGWPIYTSPVRPGREHDTTCARAHEGLLRADDRAGQEEARRRSLTIDQKCFNALHATTRALAERGNALLKVTAAALRHVSISPGRIGAMTAAALVILHLEHHRTM